MLKHAGENMYIIAGSAGIVESARVGEKNTAKLTVSVRTGTNKDTTPQYARLIAWGRLAEAMSGTIKGDAVFAMARKQEREYNGKTYTDYVCEYLSTAPMRAPVEISEGRARSELPKAAQAEETEEELPF